MLKRLPLAMLRIIAGKFDERLTGLVVERVQSWRSIVMFFIQKDSLGGPRSLKDFRGISLLAVFLK
eukprot:6742067-Lingulodinium_polyedra.AAC.1